MALGQFKTKHTATKVQRAMEIGDFEMEVAMRTHADRWALIR